MPENTFDIVSKIEIPEVLKDRKSVVVGNSVYIGGRRFI